MGLFYFRQCLLSSSLILSNFLTATCSPHPTTYTHMYSNDVWWARSFSSICIECTRFVFLLYKRQLLLNKLDRAGPGVVHGLGAPSIHSILNSLLYCLSSP